MMLCGHVREHPSVCSDSAGQLCVCKCGCGNMTRK